MSPGIPHRGGKEETTFLPPLNKRYPGDLFRDWRRHYVAIVETLQWYYNGITETVYKLLWIGCPSLSFLCTSRLWLLGRHRDSYYLFLVSYYQLILCTYYIGYSWDAFRKDVLRILLERQPQAPRRLKKRLIKKSFKNRKRVSNRRHSGLRPLPLLYFTLSLGTGGHL